MATWAWEVAIWPGTEWSPWIHTVHNLTSPPSRSLGLRAENNQTSDLATCGCIKNCSELESVLEGEFAWLSLEGLSNSLRSCVRVHLCLCVCLGVCVFVCVYVSVWAHNETNL